MQLHPFLFSVISSSVTFSMSREWSVWTSWLIFSITTYHEIFSKMWQKNSVYFSKQFLSVIQISTAFFNILTVTVRNHTPVNILNTKTATIDVVKMQGACQSSETLSWNVIVIMSSLQNILWKFFWIRP